jgi:hypothetical protein
MLFSIPLDKCFVDHFNREVLLRFNLLHFENFTIGSTPQQEFPTEIVHRQLKR